MTAITNICNAARSNCGTRGRISGLNEGSAEAAACFAYFALVRDATLPLFDWNFARFTQPLPRLAGAPARWTYAYAVPTDCLRLRRLNDALRALSETLFELAADRDSSGAAINVVFSNARSVTAVYAARIAALGSGFR